MSTAHPARVTGGRDILVRVRRGVRHPRLLLAAKASLAVAIAWIIAPFMPGVANDYPYYAPLGALISMYPTVMSSVRSGLQTLAGLVVGILLAAAVIVLWEPNVVAIALVVGIGMLIGGNKWMGAGREYVPTAALFVLIIGGPAADSYSIGYLVQMTVGVVVGLAVNLLIFPPLTVGAATTRLADFRSQLATHFDDMAAVLRESWPPPEEEWATRGEKLASTAAEVRAAIQDADDSRKGNPRAKLHAHDLTSGQQELVGLETVTFYARDITEILADTVWGGPIKVTLDYELCDPISDGFTAIAEVLRLSGGPAEKRDVEAFTRAVDDADERLTSLTAAVRRADKDHPREEDAALDPAGVIVIDLRRTLATLTREPSEAANS
ncbi:MAG TPA: FUSC family protein [Glaciihabitans sp.]|nr:FUSC family protein [Glaciihabitans sp.]